MDAIITMKETTGSLANPPSVFPRLNSYKLRALRKHIVDTLRHLQHPELPVYGWAGMSTPASIYAPIDPTLFAMPMEPGPIAVYP